MTPGEHAPILLLALALDAVIGDPDWFYRRVPHPVAVIGHAIGGLDRLLNRESFSQALRRMLGYLSTMVVLGCAGVVGWGLHAALSELPYGPALEALAASVFLAQNSLYRHVAAVRDSFTGDGLAAPRAAVSRIVGRDPEQLDEPGICRAAIESLAENFSDGVVAPAFWFLIAGLPGLLVYKALNTADSMIGHRTERHGAFGWAAARLDDLANLIPARLSALLLALSAAVIGNASPGDTLKAAFRDAGGHRSVNAGWPEAATAGALGIRLAGPRIYDGEVVEDAWMGDGRAEATPDDIANALALYVMACVFAAVGVALCVSL